jgi:hypothetical protein
VACVCGTRGSEPTGLEAGSEGSEGSEASQGSEADLEHYTQCSRPACGVWMHTAHTDAAGVAADAAWVCPACVVKVRGDAGCGAACWLGWRDVT